MNSGFVVVYVETGCRLELALNRLASSAQKTLIQIESVPEIEHQKASTRFYFEDPDRHLQYSIFEAVLHHGEGKQHTMTSSQCPIYAPLTRRTN